VAFVAAALQRRHGDRNGDLRAELLRLGKCARRQRVAGDAGGETQIIFDARRRAGLAAERARIQHQHRQPFGRRVHRRCQPRRPGADNGHIVDAFGVELGRHAQAGGQIHLAGSAQERTVGAEHDRQFVVAHAETFHQRPTFPGVAHVEQ
jgi:hypothetical protein